MRLSRVSNASGLCLIFFIIFSSCASCDSASLGCRGVNPAQLDCCHRLSVLEEPFFFMLAARFSGYATPNTSSSTVALSGLGRLSSWAGSSWRLICRSLLQVNPARLDS